MKANEEMYLNIVASQNILSVVKTVVRSCSKKKLEGKTFIRHLSLCKLTNPATGSGGGPNLYDRHKTSLGPPTFLSDVKSFGLHQRRFYRGSQQNRNTKETPQLMNFPWVIWPSIWYTFRNWIFANLIIRPYLDKDFTLSSFKSGAIQAIVHVSQELSKGNFNALEGFITKPSLEEAQHNYALLSLKQRLDLAVVAEDIFFCFPYQIGVIFTNEGGPKERIFVEITMCYHVFKGLQDHIENLVKTDNSGPLQGVYDNYDRISIANYRFIREFTKGVDDDWTVNVANHFKPGEYIQQQR